MANQDDAIDRVAGVYMPATTALDVGRTAAEYPVASQAEAVDRLAGVYIPATAALVADGSDVNPHLDTQYAIPVMRL